MSFPFDARRGLVIARAELFGPSGSIVLRLALDTGATGTMANIAPLAAVGYDPSLEPERVQVTTGSNIEFVPHIIVGKTRLWDKNAPISRSSATPFPRARAWTASSD